MDITFNELREKEIINVLNGKRMGRVEDIIFDKDEGTIKGVMVPGERKLFKKSDDIFIPINELRKIGEDVILVKRASVMTPIVPNELQNLEQYKSKREVKKEN